MSKVSVITTVYNETLNQVKRAIESVKDQSSSIEYVQHVIVIDNPGYDYIEYLNDLPQKMNTDSFSLEIYVNDKNIGLAQSLNRAIKLSKFELLARLDSDDWMNNDRLLQQSAMFQEREVDIVYTDTLEYEGSRQNAVYLNSLNEDKVATLLPLRNFIIHSSVMFKKSILREIGLYRDLVPAEDYDLWLRMLNSGKKFGYIPMPLTSREIRLESISNSDLNLQMRMADFVRYINKQGLESIKEKPRKMDNQKKLDKINKKIIKFRSTKGLKKIIIGTTSIFILKSSINDVIYKLKLQFSSR